MRRWLLSSVLLASCTGGTMSDAGLGPDATGVDAGTDGGGVDGGGTDGGATDAGPYDAGPPADFAEPPGDDTDPFTGGAPTDTGLELAPGDTRTLSGTIASDGGSDAWADSDGYRFRVTTETQVQATLEWTGSSAVHSIAIHRADRHLVAWWGMSTEGRSITHPVTLPVGDYFVHVAAAPPAPASPRPYRVTLSAGDFGACASGAGGDHAELEAPGSVRDNDAFSVDWYAFPRLGATSAVDAAEATGLTVEAGGSRVIEGTSDRTAPDADSYLDRDAYEVTAGAGVTELRVLLEHAVSDVNLDVMVFSASDGLVGTGVEVGDSPEVASIPVVPGQTYRLWIGARDERAIGADGALPLTYRATVCGFVGGAR